MFGPCIYLLLSNALLLTGTTIMQISRDSSKIQSSTQNQPPRMIKQTTPFYEDFGQQHNKGGRTSWDPFSHAEQTSIAKILGGANRLKVQTTPWEDFDGTTFQATWEQIGVRSTESMERTRLKELVNEHDRVCTEPVSCQKRAKKPLSSSCCGSCSCDETCKSYGTCCPVMYDSLNEARRAMENSRYECIDLKFLKSSETDYMYNGNKDWIMRTWLITKCNIDSNSDVISALCENESSTLDSIVPVTNPITNTHYRNKYCAMCSGLNQTVFLIQWKVRIVANHDLNIPLNDILFQIIKDRGNIFYIPPKYLKVPICHHPVYTIDSCNVTGRWPAHMYNTNIQNACHSFIDPFNYTYKNVFCYFCNTETVASDPTELNCPITDLLDVYPTSKSPPYSTILDANLIENDMESRLNDLECELHQFEDVIQNKCRDVQCEAGHSLTKGECAISEQTDGQCFSVFLKLVPDDTTSYILMTSLEFGHRGIFRDNLRDVIETLIRAKSAIFLDFYKLNDLTSIKYMVVYVVFDFSNTLEKDRTIRALMETTTLSFWPVISELDFNFQVELESHEIKFYDLHSVITATVEVNTLGEQGATTDQLSQNFTIGNASYDMCSQNKIFPLSKLPVCPFIILTPEELPLKIKNNFLTIYEDFQYDRLLKSFSTWSYGFHGNNISICLHDYLEIYQALLQRFSLSETSDGTRLSWFLICLILPLLYFLADCLVDWRY